MRQEKPLAFFAILHVIPSLQRLMVDTLLTPDSGSDNPGNEGAAQRPIQDQRAVIVTVTRLSARVLTETILQLTLTLA